MDEGMIQVDSKLKYLLVEGETLYYPTLVVWSILAALILASFL